MRILTLTVLTLCFLTAVAAAQNSGAGKPNIIFILADDIARADIGPYGQTKIKTPSLDKFAQEGVRFTQAYSGASVCAPSRATLMTGLDTGHCPIRANREISPEGQKPLPEGTYTVAKQLKSSGYATLCTGKWGMGMFESTGSPLKMGFDHFYGYNCQRHAHSYYPKYLYDNAQKVEFDGKTYSQDSIIGNTLDWIRQHKDEPFFVFYAATLPHGNYEIDDLGEYEKENWTREQKTYAAMCTRLDKHVGQILQLLDELKLDENTILFFAGDNGSSFAPNSPTNKFFNSNGDLRGFKRTTYEGGLRQAFLVRWAKHIAPNSVNDTPIAFWDFLPTAAELSGGKIPDTALTNGISILPALLDGKKPERDTLYWELHEGKPIQGARWKDWKFVKNGFDKPIELYDLKTDISESKNLAEQNPEIVKIGEELLRTHRQDHPDWQLQKQAEKK